MEITLNLPKLEHLEIVHQFRPSLTCLRLDSDPDLSYLGTFSNEPGPNAIEHKPRDYRECAYFNPAMTAEQTGNPDSPQQDYDRMLAYCRGDWEMLGIQARAVIAVDIAGKRWEKKLKSGGIWGVESDSGAKYFRELAKIELNDLRSQLESNNVDMSDWDEMAAEALDEEPTTEG